MDIVKVLAVLVCLSAGRLVVPGVELSRLKRGGCSVDPWDFKCIKKCPYREIDWRIAAENYNNTKNCSIGEGYHCAKDTQTNKFVEVCAKPVFCGPGTEPQIEIGSTVSIVCKNCSDDRYNFVQNKSSDDILFDQCPYKKLTCGEGQIECEIKDGFERLTRDRKCRCDVRNGYWSVNVLTCTSDGSLMCVNAPKCNSSESEEIMLDYSCGPRCPGGYFRNETSDLCIPDDRSEENQTVPNGVPDQGNGSDIHPSEAPTTSSIVSVNISSSIKPLEGSGAVQNISTILWIIGAGIAVIVMFVIIVIIASVRHKIKKTGHCHFCIFCSKIYHPGVSRESAQPPLSNTGVSQEESAQPLLSNTGVSQEESAQPLLSNTGVPQESAQPSQGNTEVVQETFEDFKAKYSREVLSRSLEELDLIGIATAIGKNWDLLGPFLHIKEIKIQHIQKDIPNNSIGQITEMLKYWTRISDSHTFENLLKALFEAKRVVNIDWKTINDWAQEHTTLNAASDGHHTETSSTTSAAGQSGDLSSPTNTDQPDHETLV